MRDIIGPILYRYINNRTEAMEIINANPQFGKTYRLYRSTYYINTRKSFYYGRYVFLGMIPIWCKKSFITHLFRYCGQTVIKIQKKKRFRSSATFNKIPCHRITLRAMNTPLYSSTGRCLFTWAHGTDFQYRSRYWSSEEKKEEHAVYESYSL